MISLRLPLLDPSGVGEARRRAVALARNLGFDEEGAGQVALVVTEAATNVVRHGGGGELLVNASEDASIELLAIDRGPGMDVDACLRDGYSTGGTRGAGLGAISRIAHSFDAYSGAGGTVVLARLRKTPPARPEHFRCGAVNLPAPNEEACGDDWAGVTAGDRRTFLLVDGLGHGPAAALAARAGVEAFRAAAGRSALEIVEQIHLALRPTRGAAGGVLTVDASTRAAEFVGVGNIAAALHHEGKVAAFVSMNGILGHGSPRLQTFTHPWPAGALLVMHSDGLTTHWRLDRYPGLAARDPAVISAVLYRDFNRGRDDVTVLSGREARA